MAELRPDYSRLTVHHVGVPGPVSGPAIVLCFDEGYSFPAQVALVSIFLNSASRSLDIVVLAFEWTDPTVAVFDRLARRFGRPLTIVRAGHAALPSSFATTRPRLAGFLRLLIPEMLAGDRFLYLDADIVARIDLDEIWVHCRDDMLVGGVFDPIGREWQRLLYAKPEIYINSGVLLINGRAWREERALQRCAEWLAANPDRRLADQDTLNTALAGGVYVIPDCWNVIRLNQLPSWRLDPDTFRGILHYADFTKPWVRWHEPAQQAFYLHYARVVGLPAGYWVETTTAPQAMIEAHWADEQGDIAKANRLHKRAAEAALAKLRELDPKLEVQLR